MFDLSDDLYLSLDSSWNGLGLDPIGPGLNDVPSDVNTTLDGSTYPG